MPLASNGGVDVYYEVDGPSDSPTVVLVEGLGYGRWMWNWQRDALAERYETIVVDNRGTGKSDAPEGPYSIAEMAADVEAVLADHGHQTTSDGQSESRGDSDDGVERAHLVGASMGGMIVQRYALDYDRAASISLLCSSPGGEDAPAASPEVQARMVAEPEGYDEREVIRHRMAPAMTDGFPAQNDDLLERIVDWRLEQDADEAPREAQLAAVGAFDAADRLGEIEVPALVAHGTADRILPVENADLLADGLPDARLELFEGGPHLFFIEQSDAVNETLLAFLDEHAAGGRTGGDAR